MKRILGAGTALLVGFVLASPALASPARPPLQGATDATALEVASPSGAITVALDVAEGRPRYSVSYRDRVVVSPSRLGFRFRNVPAFEDGIRIARSERGSFDETWEQPWGEVRHVRNHYNELAVDLEEANDPGRTLRVVFRAFDAGVGFRFEWPDSGGFGSFEIMNELTEFAFAEDHSAWFIPAGYSRRYEYLYEKSPISGLGAVHTPLTIETRDGLYVAIHEAALTDYASMTLQANGTPTLHCDLVPWSDGAKVKGQAPFVSPWRTLQIAESPGGLLTSYLALNLNEPSRISDTSWIKPGKYVGIWWGMHLGRWTWASGEHAHGATTARTKRYMDFAAEHGFDGVLVEGWNVGWDGDWFANAELFSFTESYPDFDLEDVVAYGRTKGVKLIGHHETSFGIENYERQVEDAFGLYERLGVSAVKTGYVSDQAPRRELQHGQYMVRHYRKIVELAARHHIVLDVHEPVKDTGIRRTWPNMMTREGARGMEFSSGGGGSSNPPDYESTISFTRMLAGPFDYTPGIFDLELKSANGPRLNRVNMTLAKALANYVVIYSPLHMAADLIENYAGRPAFRFIEDVPTDWEETRVLNAVIGDFVTIARRDRNSDDWYVGSVSDEFARSFDISLSFLDPGREYFAEIYADAHNADWENKPHEIVISERPVDSETVLPVRLAPGGGTAIRIRPAR